MQLLHGVEDAFVHGALAWHAWRTSLTPFVGAGPGDVLLHASAPTRKILPYKSGGEEKIAKEAAMAVGEASGGPRRVVRAGGAKRRDSSEPVEALDADAFDPNREIVHELDPGMQKLLDEEEEIQRRLGGGDDHGPGKFHQE